MPPAPANIAHSALPGEPQPRASTIEMSRSPSAATSVARCLYRASMGAHRSGPKSPREVAVANRPRCEPGRAGLRNRAGRQAPRGSPGSAVQDEVVPEPERRQYLRQRGVIDHLLQIAGHPGRLSPGRFIAAGRRHRDSRGRAAAGGLARGPRDRQGRSLAGLPRQARPVALLSAPRSSKTELWPSSMRSTDAGISGAYCSQKASKGSGSLRPSTSMLETLAQLAGPGNSDPRAFPKLLNTAEGGLMAWLRGWIPARGPE